MSSRRPPVFFTSDLHLGHAKVAALRGFESTTVHDAAIAATWEAQVTDDAVVWVLGDISAGGRAATEHALRTLATLPGRKRLVLGNHDPAHPMNRNAHKWWPAFAEVFEVFTPFATERVDGTDVLLSHFPYVRDRHEPRYLQWRLRDHGEWLLHGHTHGPERLTEDWSEVHVGWDAWHALVHEQQVAHLLVPGLDLSA